MLRLFILLVTIGIAYGFGWGIEAEEFSKVFAAKQLFTQCVGEDEAYRILDKFSKACKACKTGKQLPDVKMSFRYNPINTNNIYNRPPYNPPYNPNRAFNTHYNPHYNHPTYNQYPGYPNTYRSHGYPSNNYHIKKKREVKEVRDEAEAFYWKHVAEKMKYKFGNMSCVLKTCGYMDDDGELQYNELKNTYSNWPLPQHIKEDLIEAVDLCKDVSECIPEEYLEKCPYGKEFGRTYKFLLCIKQAEKKMCMKKALTSDYYRYKQRYGSTKNFNKKGKDEESTILDYYNEDLFFF